MLTATLLDGDELSIGCEDGTICSFQLSFLAASGLLGTASVSSSIVESTVGPTVIARGAAPVRCLDVSPDGELGAAGTQDGGICLYRHDTGEVVRRLVQRTTGNSNTPVDSVAFSPNGRWLSHTGENGLATVHDVSTGEIKLSHVIGTGFASTFLGDEQSVAFGGQFEGTQIFDLKTGQLSRTIEAANARSLDVSPDRRWIASTHRNGTVQLTATASQPQARVIPGHLSFGQWSAFLVRQPDARQRGQPRRPAIHRRRSRHRLGTAPLAA